MSRNIKTKKSRRFLPSKYSDMEFESKRMPRHGEEIFHFSHPYHPLVQVSTQYLYTCNGCKEYGAGKRFKCKICEFDLHDFCALAPPTLLNHPLHQQHRLVFFTNPGAFNRSKCDICGKAAKGYAFSCTACGFVMHPCCATMNSEMTSPTHPHPITLLPPHGGNSNFAKCDVCRKKCSDWVYGCFACGYHMHALCAKEMINGLYIHGIKPPLEKTNMFETAAKVAAHAIFGFIGELVEGIGEGIGEALMDNIGRSRSANMRKKKTEQDGDGI